MQTIINWTKFNGKNIPSGYGWYVVILKPKNYKECEETNDDYSGWITKFGFDLTFLDNKRFWEGHYHDITDRVLYFAEQPEGFI